MTLLFLDDFYAKSGNICQIMSSAVGGISLGVYFQCQENFLLHYVTPVYFGWKQ